MVLMIASGLFEAFYVENLFFAIIAALILSLLNATIKPILVIFTLPLNIITLGIAYPLVNVIILQFCDFLMGSTFDISGFFASFFIAVFIASTASSHSGVVALLSRDISRSNADISFRDYLNSKNLIIVLTSSSCMV